MIELQEHGHIDGIEQICDRYENLSLVSWCKPMDKTPWGYYASYFIGTEWIDEQEALIVTPKQGMEHIDFLGMFMTCFTSNLEVESFSQIYTLSSGQKAISAPALSGVVSPLIVLHFLGVVSRIKTLKKGYVHHSENLKKVKGHIAMIRNERKNIAIKRYDRVFCEYDEYSEDIPENRLIKKALLFSQRLLKEMGESHRAYYRIKHTIIQCLGLFERVSDEVEMRNVGQSRSHKLYKDYAEAVRLAKLVLKHFDYSISNVTIDKEQVIPFTLDMSLLYEHYVYGLLHEAYQNNVLYQYEGETGKPDFLYRSNKFKAILDTKYIPKYVREGLDTYVTRQLSGYSRDLRILKGLGYYDIKEDTPLPPVPCVIIYPEEGIDSENPFLNKPFERLCNKKVKNLLNFYKIVIPIPTLE